MNYLNEILFFLVFCTPKNRVVEYWNNRRSRTYESSSLQVFESKNQLTLTENYES